VSARKDIFNPTFNELLPELCDTTVVALITSRTGPGDHRRIELHTKMFAARSKNLYVVTIGENSWEYSTLTAAVRHYTGQ